MRQPPRVANPIERAIHDLEKDLTVAAVAGGITAENCHMFVVRKQLRKAIVEIGFRKNGISVVCRVFYCDSLIHEIDELSQQAVGEAIKELVDQFMSKLIEYKQHSILCDIRGATMLVRDYNKRIANIRVGATNEDGDNDDDA